MTREILIELGFKEEKRSTPGGLFYDEKGSS